MKKFVKNYSSIVSLIISILFFILGAVMFTNPDAIVLFISYVIGGIIILIGTFKCIKNYLDVKKDNKTSSNGMVIGITLIVIGLVFIFLAGVIEALVRLVIGGWILFTGIMRLVNTLSIEKKDNKFWVLLAISIILIGGGLYTILETNLAFKAIGLVLMLYSVVEIFGYVFNKKEISEIIVTKEKEEKIEEAVLIESKEKKENKKKKNKKDSN